MSGDPVSWLSEFMAGMRTDPGLPPGAIALETGTERVARTIRSGRHAPGTEEAWEDYRSFAESFPYLIRASKRGDPILCECCGTLVAMTPEALGTDGPWKPGIWEHETLRRHTLRRCEWKEGNP